MTARQRSEVGPAGRPRPDFSESAKLRHYPAFRIVATSGDAEDWVTNDLSMDERVRVTYAGRSWAIEEYHRGLEPFTEVERCQARRGRSQRNHIGFARRAFVRLECHRFHTGVSWFEAKGSIIREAVRNYLSNPRYQLPSGPTA